MAESEEFDKPSWLTGDQVARRLSVPIVTLFAWRDQGTGPPWLILGHEIRYDETDLLHWIKTTYKPNCSV
jgi:hypothetical protein